MPIVHTPKDLGLAIRTRRKELGWDQANLAAQIGVTRQWVIDIEKGKPRAELELAMRALRVLGLSMNVRRRVDAVLSDASAPQSEARAPDLDINAIVERNRQSPDTENNKTYFATYVTPPRNSVVERAFQRLDKVANLKPPKDTAKALQELESHRVFNQAVNQTTQSVAKRAMQRLESESRKTSAKALSELAGSSAASQAAKQSAQSVAQRAIQRLNQLATHKLPKTSLDYVREYEATNTLRRVENLTRLSNVKSTLQLVDESIASQRQASSTLQTKRAKPASETGKKKAVLTKAKKKPAASKSGRIKP